MRLEHPNNHTLIPRFFPVFLCPMVLLKEIGFYFSIFLLIFAQDLLIKLYFIYFIILFLAATYKSKNFIVGYLSVKAAWKQFSGYGFGFLESFYKIFVLKQQPEKAYPELFFKK